ncbi:hypothetical protein GO755_31285 [Spirosoma sp. HMF4905]|uniref:Resolvase/invertase-type recombinase catalytic domain-containing protein n=1 Tax=Spirosoma arboris TaxID=2682092 RepID=A0A7K1SLA5_9BACT|nr:recombinase family protein [Spirosoma arboris]MVM34554.1 hypothetical protein [Spirosoma arboris]
MQQGVILVRYYKREWDYPRQLNDLRMLARRQALQITTEIVEKIGQLHPLRESDGLNQLLRLSREQTVQQVLVWEVTRLGRSTDEIRSIITELTTLGVNIYIHNLRIDTLVNGQFSPAARLLVMVLDELTHMELSKLRERLSICKKRDRPSSTEHDADQQPVSPAYLTKYPAVVLNLRAGISLRKTARLCHVSINTVRKVNDCLFRQLY